MPKIEWDPPKITDQEIETFLGNNSGLVGVDRNRMSRLLCEQLAFGIKSRTLDSFGVTDVLQGLEGHRTGGHVKVRPFDYPPLKGLFHTHFQQAAFMPTNLENEIKNKRGKTLIEGVFKDKKLSDGERLKLASYQATVGLYNSRSANNALTGEWVIYAEYQGKHYYFCIASHLEGDAIIYNRMMKRCESFFQQIIQSVTGASPIHTTRIFHSMD
jgi:hypothetical protein